MSEIVEIVRLAHAGHGVTADGVYVPLTVPGDVVRITPSGSRARLEEVVMPGASRTTPVCRHFGRCGGCALQMMERAAYLAWKRELVVTALRQRGFSEPPVEAVQSVPAGTRRRASMKCKMTGSQVAVGFFETDSHRLVNIEQCPVVVPDLAALFAPVKRGLARLLEPGEQAELHATASDTGIDLSLRLARRRSPDFLMQLSEFAGAVHIARLCWNGEPVVVNRTPALQIGAVTISLPPECFLQPSEAGQKLLQDLVCELLKPSRQRIADLFSGCGTFSFAIPAGSQTLAIDSSEPQIAALNDAARQSGRAVKGEVRDLFRRPLTPAELDAFDTVILDPPRAGAPAQSRCLAQSVVPSLLYVSCNAATFARDARTLCDGGYTLVRVVPVDQFLWTPHVELFAQFSRAPG